MWILSKGFEAAWWDWLNLFIYSLVRLQGMQRYFGNVATSVLVHRSITKFKTDQRFICEAKKLAFHITRII